MTNFQIVIKQKQKGSALIIGLTILVIMLIIGTAGMRTTIMEEKMAGNARDLNNAFQAAEGGLVDGEYDLLNFDIVNSKKPIRSIDYSKSDFTVNCGLTQTTRDFDGLCLPELDPTEPPQWLVIDWTRAGTPGTNPLPYREYGQRTKINDTSPPDLLNVSRQPRYILEYLGKEMLGSLEIGQAKQVKITFYRVTTQGYGIAMTDDSQPIARVMLQSIYGK